ncbi:hypothetical protein DS031_14090 [Bacillus taeanensis]|uniref:YkyB-like protein n=1 Tax=Bacillus taeanensis TaxID=273032 RepID=A0A366XW01_9BACI|nr:hypothetical protein DS031_14090 [Bacillus taeanensis]
MSLEDIAVAIYIVNKHAKVAAKTSDLYSIKQKTIKRLLHEGKAQKVGLHFSTNPRLSQQHLDVLVKVGHFMFHIPSNKLDRNTLPVLGERNDLFRNPKIHMSLKKAKSILISYIGKDYTNKKKRKHHDNSGINYKGLSTFLNS